MGDIGSTFLAAINIGLIIQSNNYSQAIGLLLVLGPCLVDPFTCVIRRFSNGEKIGDGIIKLPLLNEFKRRLPNYKLYWMTDQGSTVYASTLKNIASNYIYTFFEKANLNYFFSRKISNKFDLEKEYFDIIFEQIIFSNNT